MILLKQVILAVLNIMVGAAERETHLDPVLLACCRVFLSTITLFAVAYYKGMKIKLNPEDDKLMRVLGVLALIIVLCYIYSVSWTSPVNVSLFKAGAPVFTAAIMLMMKRERFSVKRFGGIVITLVGCVVLVFGGEHDDTMQGNEVEVLLGNVLLFFNLIASSLFLVFQMRVVHTIHPGM